MRTRGHKTIGSHLKRYCTLACSRVRENFYRELGTRLAQHFPGVGSWRWRLGSHLARGMARHGVQLRNSWRIFGVGRTRNAPWFFGVREHFKTSRKCLQTSE